MTIAMRIAAVLVVIAAVWAGKYVVSLVFHAAGVHTDGDKGLLRGGLWIGYLERLGIVTAILTGYPAGIAVILGVKTLARYAELKSQPTPGTGAQAANEESSAGPSSSSSSGRWHRPCGPSCWPWPPRPCGADPFSPAYQGSRGTSLDTRGDGEAGPPVGSPATAVVSQPTLAQSIGAGSSFHTCSA